MMMIPSRGGFLDYIKYVKVALDNNTLTMDRLNDAVAKIVAVKLALGIAEEVKSSNVRFQKEEQSSYRKLEEEPLKSETTEYEDSLQAVQESLVLLKN